MPPGLCPAALGLQTQTRKTHMLDIGSNTRDRETRGNIIKFQLRPLPPEAALKQADRIPLARLGLPFVGPEAHSPADSEDAGNRLCGAAWSVDVNRRVNAPETWQRG
jgi:hypothetical protein